VNTVAHLHAERLQADADVTAVRELRHRAGKTLENWSIEEEVRECALVACSELLTNALIYGATPILALDMELRDGWLRLTAHDRNPDPPYNAHPDAQADHGRGIELVIGLADAWGCRATKTGKSVFAEFEIDSDHGRNTLR